MSSMLKTTSCNYQSNTKSETNGSICFYPVCVDRPNTNKTRGYVFPRARRSGGTDHPNTSEEGAPPDPWL